jgi:hypothetical protein
LMHPYFGYFLIGLALVVIIMIMIPTLHIH